METLEPLRVSSKWICLSIVLVLLYAIPSSSTDASLDVPRNVSVDGIMFEGEILGKPPKCRHRKYCKLKSCRNAPICKDKKKPKEEKERVEYCETDRCLKTARVIKANMDERIDPCDDFYSFACNGFSKQNPQPEGSNYRDVDFQIKYDVIDKLIKILLRIYSKTSQSKALAEARTNFQICHKRTKSSYGCAKRAMKSKDIWPLARGYVINFGMKNRERKDLERMMSNIRESFMDDLSAIPWLDDSTEKRARKKAKAVKFVLSHNDELFKHDEIPPKMLNADGRLKEDVTFDLPTSVNAIYIVESNTIFLPRAMMSYPFFNTGLPVLDYAAMGSVLAHEFTHSFDSCGRNYDENGYKKDWWSAEAAEQFKRRERWFKEQYGQFFITTKKGEKLYLNSNFTINEDISDNGGVSLAYRAFKKLHPKKEKLYRLDEYTDEQLFFIGYANSFCRSETVEFTEETIENDEHSPSKYRVNVPLSNMKAFARAFKCREGSNMNPRKKIEIW
ncbi:Hypothetical predicted protein [Cloeon dipterum]|uniref:Peptidase M13 C-terminal domain-containing protein n=2 Tax=Cloeon dipterum TaxID=197152 RepID=A0A8S1E3E5_9INSE|nr:Hypothetical predicted protein [Cloeon dipterum]